MKHPRSSPAITAGPRGWAILVRAAGLCAAEVCCAACAATVERTRARADPGELESLGPTASADGTTSTGSSTRAVLSGHRLRVQRLVSDYFDAILAQDGGRAASLLFVERLVTADGNEPYWSLNELVEHHRSASGRTDLSYLRLQLEQPDRGPVIRSITEVRRSNASAFVAALPGDWIVELPFVVGAPMNSMARYLPSRWVVRFVAGAPRVVAISPVIPLRI
jgi:hypothetical protein